MHINKFDFRDYLNCHSIGKEVKSPYFWKENTLTSLVNSESYNSPLSKAKILPNTDLIFEQETKPYDVGSSICYELIHQVDNDLQKKSTTASWKNNSLLVPDDDIVKRRQCISACVANSDYITRTTGIVLDKTCVEITVDNGKNIVHYSPDYCPPKDNIVAHCKKIEDFAEAISRARYDYYSDRLKIIIEHSDISKFYKHYDAYLDLSSFRQNSYFDNKALGLRQYSCIKKNSYTNYVREKTVQDISDKDYIVDKSDNLEDNIQYSDATLNEQYTYQDMLQQNNDMLQQNNDINISAPDKNNYIDEESILSNIINSSFNILTTVISVFIFFSKSILSVLEYPYSFIYYCVFQESVVGNSFYGKVTDLCYLVIDYSSYFYDAFFSILDYMINMSPISTFYSIFNNCLETCVQNVHSFYSNMYHIMSYTHFIYDDISYGYSSVILNFISGILLLPFQIFLFPIVTVYDLFYKIFTTGQQSSAIVSSLLQSLSLLNNYFVKQISIITKDVLNVFMQLLWRYSPNIYNNCIILSVYTFDILKLLRICIYNVNNLMIQTAIAFPIFVLNTCFSFIHNMLINYAYINITSSLYTLIQTLSQYNTEVITSFLLASGIYNNVLHHMFNMIVLFVSSSYYRKSCVNIIKNMLPNFITESTDNTFKSRVVNIVNRLLNVSYYLPLIYKFAIFFV